MDAFVGEIRAVGFNFAPRGWALCNGALMPINRSTALFSILGTQYGGDGSTTFALPDLRGRAIVQTGQGPGLSNYVQGQMNGVEGVSLVLGQIPAHTHTVTSAQLKANSATSNGTSPADSFLGGSGTVSQYGEEAAGLTMATNSVTGDTSVAGAGAPHSNMMPYLVLNYIIALEGIFPPRS